MIWLETILQALGDVGFPMAVTAYLLVRIESKLEALAAGCAIKGEKREANKQ